MGKSKKMVECPKCGEIYCLTDSMLSRKAEQFVDYDYEQEQKIQKLLRDKNIEFGAKQNHKRK